MLAFYKKLSLAQQMTVPIALVGTFVLAGLGYIESKELFRITKEGALNTSVELAKKSSQEIKTKIDRPFIQAEVIGRSFLMKIKKGKQNRLDGIEELQEVLKANPDYFATWSAFEPNAFDGHDEKYKNTQYHETSGRYYPWWIRQGNELTYKTLINEESPDLGDWYFAPQQSKKSMLVEPYSDTVNGKQEVMSSAVHTIVDDGKFLGIVGVDLSLEMIQNIVTSVKPFETSKAYLLTDSKMVVSSPNADELMKPYQGYTDILKMIDAQSLQYQELTINKEKALFLVIPVDIFNTGQKWTLIIETPMSSILTPAYQAIAKQAGFSLIALFVLMFSVFISAKKSSQKIGTLSTNLTESASNIHTSINQLNQTGSELASSSTAAAASIEQTAASLEEVTSMVQLNTENAKMAANLSIESADLAKNGESEIKKLITTMNQIEGSSQKIEEIIHIIDDIAFQTNLLALNASVEAARAGEHGKGFAVVADAVRSLAQRSASAAKDISSLILTSVDQIKVGTKTAQQNGEILHKISSSIVKVSQLNTEIAQASVEQANGITVISKSIHDLDAMVQKSAAQAEEIVETAQDIESKSEVMNTTVYSLKGA